MFVTDFSFFFNILGHIPYEQIDNKTAVSVHLTTRCYFDPIDFNRHILIKKNNYCRLTNPKWCGGHDIKILPILHWHRQAYTPIFRPNPCFEVTNQFCQILLPTLWYILCPPMFSTLHRFHLEFIS